jgi:hypothetical protein
MSKRGFPWLALATLMAAGAGGTAAAADYSYPIAGLTPYERPVGAPVITQFDKDGTWYTQALHGVDRPYPSSLGFLENQGAWHTPFNRPGAPPPYDIRGWYQN